MSGPNATATAATPAGASAAAGAGGAGGQKRKAFKGEEKPMEVRSRCVETSHKQYSSTEAD